MRKKMTWILTVLLLLAAMPAVTATSLWSDAGSAATMFSDRKARNVGDTITIIVEEQTSAANRADTNTKKDSNVNMGAGSGFLLKAVGGASNTYGDKYASSGSTSRSNSLTAKITAQVIEVKPNGNLVISGKQTIKVNGEDQKISVTGTVRPEDISPDNTVYSTALADSNVQVNGKGVLASKQKPGLLHRLFGWLF
ncbi:MAG: flagellar basal body L-ring protein FlgH [Bacillota bacterium]|nr:flagellar biosynthesis protein FlgH [Bacillota bacterium]HWR55129.1 flagellar basal body L-ring protein FlgH [Negativicutes bacterium]